METVLASSVPLWFGAAHCKLFETAILTTPDRIRFSRNGGFCELVRSSQMPEQWFVQYTVVDGNDQIFATPYFSMSAKLLRRAFGLDEPGDRFMDLSHIGKPEFCVRCGRYTSLHYRENKGPFAIFMTDELMQQLEEVL